MTDTPLKPSKTASEALSTGWLTFDRDRSSESGSTRIRAKNVIKYGKNHHLFQVGTRYDAVVFQKYYWHDYARIFDGIKVFDICDPDWLSGSPTIDLVRLLEDMDGVTANTPEMASWMAKATDKPIRVVPDRHDLEYMKQRKTHTGRAESVVWFGYSHNAHVLKPYVPKLMELGLRLTIISEKFVTVAGNNAEFKDMETFVKYPSDGRGGTDVLRMNDELIRHDIALLPSSRKIQDKYKSNNKPTHAWMVGLPVAFWGDDLDTFLEAEARQKDQAEHCDSVREEYDCRKSVQQYDDFIAELAEIRRNRGQQV